MSKSTNGSIYHHGILPQNYRYQNCNHRVFKLLLVQNLDIEHSINVSFW
ncbi:hypothetical protein [Nostoc sp. CENA543]|nr:hypothetical protein [Nostoc sp. CENA543]